MCYVPRVQLAWPGLKENRGGDALAFLQGFDLDLEDYDELGRLFDFFKKTQVSPSG